MGTQHYYRLIAQKLIGEFEKRNMEGVFCENANDALEKLTGMIPQNALVSCGGSVTLREIGILDILKSGGYRFINPHIGDSAEKEKSAHEALIADYYLMSANAVSVTGELVNADGIGNRVAALVYGPKNVIVVAGMNKVEYGLESAVRRVKMRAAQNCLTLFKQDYASFDELQRAADKSVSHLVITSGSVYKGRIKILLVGETLGL
jgi:hypothetical protein